MSISTRCRTIQIIEPNPSPPYDVTDLDENSLAVEEGGALALTEGVTEYDIPFAVEKLSADYDFIEDDISNEEDLDPLSIAYNFTNRTATGFTLVLDSQPDSAHYLFRWRVKVREVA